MQSEKVNGVKYNIVTFVLQNKYKNEGCINDQKMVETARTWVGNDVNGGMLVEGVYSAYKDFGGVKVPTISWVSVGLTSIVGLEIEGQRIFAKRQPRNGTRRVARLFVELPP